MSVADTPGARHEEGGYPHSSETNQNGSQPHSNPGYADIPNPNQHGGYISPKHIKMLMEESAISQEAIEARGYFTTTDRAVLEKLGFDRKQASTAAAGSPVLVIPLFDHKGEIIRHAIRPDIPRVDSRNGKAFKYENPAGSGMVLDFAPLTCEHIDDPKVPCIITEGAKKADAAASQGYCAINLSGVFGFRGKNAKGGTTVLPEWEYFAIKDRLFLLAFDSDLAIKPHVEKALSRCAEFLAYKGARVQVVYFEPGPNGEKTGLDDFFARGGTKAELLELARDLKSKDETKKERRAEQQAAKQAALNALGRPVIETADRLLDEIIDQIAETIGHENKKAPTLFHGPVGLARIFRDKNEVSTIGTATTEIVQDYAARVASFVSTSESGGTTCVAPPKTACSIFVQTSHNWKNIPPLDGIATAPVFGPDGGLCTQTGYHASARLWLDLPPGLQIPDSSPTPENLEWAKQLIIEEVLGEVAFADQASRCHAVAQMVLPFMRRMIQGTSPLHLWDAPVQSSGKSYAAELCILPFSGVDPPNIAEIKDENEWLKTISTVLAEGWPHIFLDNITGRLNNPALVSAITAAVTGGRILGVSKMLQIRTTHATWVGSANNARLDKDAAERIVLIRLDTQMESPTERKYKRDAKAFVRANRADVICALLVLVRNWIEAGQPRFKERSNKFKEWCEVMGGVMEAAGIPGFLENMAEARENLTSGDDAWEEFVLKWWDEYESKPVAAKQLVGIAERCEGLSGMLGRDDKKYTKVLGEMLARRRHRIFAGLKIEKETLPDGGRKRTNHGAQWFLSPTSSFDPERVSAETDFEEGGEGSSVPPGHAAERGRSGLFDDESGEI